MSTCLAVNTATSLMSLAILRDDGDLLYYFETPEIRGQTNALIEHIRTGLTQSGLSFSDLDLLCAVEGPGSFTGIRLGIAAMRGIGLAANIPVTGVSSFDMFDPKGQADIVVVESWREELYFRYENAAPVNLNPADFVATLPTSKTRFTVAGDAVEKIMPLLSGSNSIEEKGNAKTAAHLAMKQTAHQKPIPLYVRPPDISTPKVRVM